MDDGLQIFKTGTTISFTGTSANTALPTAQDGNNPRYVRIASTQACYVKIGTSGLTAAAGDVLVQPADAVILCVNGCTHIAAIQVAAAGICQISPVENL